MYYRSQGYRYPKDMHIPINYGGNAFSDTEQADTAEDTSIKSNADDTSIEAIAEISDAKESNTNEEKAAPTSSLLSSLGSGSLFGGRIGSEELLILALVFLLSDTDADSDIIWLLLLLLFIK